ncbi:MAG: hypothetical protein GWO24_37510, partial [Akkermansiaceae bacterium]|nr:hypothetical protein [Akkermansiaceae bacterium]
RRPETKYRLGRIAGEIAAHGLQDADQFSGIRLGAELGPKPGVVATASEKGNLDYLPAG